MSMSNPGHTFPASAFLSLGYIRRDTRKISLVDAHAKVKNENHTIKINDITTISRQYNDGRRLK